jgi:hypothetical protein
MLRNHFSRSGKRGWSALAVALAVLIPFAAFAQAPADTTTTPDTTTETAAAQTTTAHNRGMGNMPSGGGADAFSNGTADVSALTDDQKTVYDQAVALYEGVEDQVLGDLVTAGVVTQADTDAYIALRAAEKTLSDLDMSGWTAEQYKAYYEANAKTGDERKAAMQALADAGQLTQEQADALAVQGEDDLWDTLSANAQTNSAIQQAINTMQQARNTLQQTLREAGISAGGTGNGMNRGNGTGSDGPNQGAMNGGNEQNGSRQNGGTPQNGQVTQP